MLTIQPSPLFTSNAVLSHGGSAAFFVIPKVLIDPSSASASSSLTILCQVAGGGFAEGFAGHLEKRWWIRLVLTLTLIKANVIWARRERACTMEDVLSRRPRLAFLNKDAALEAIPKVASRMSTELEVGIPMDAARSYVEYSYCVHWSEIGRGEKRDYRACLLLVEELFLSDGFRRICCFVHALPAIFYNLFLLNSLKILLAKQVFSRNASLSQIEYLITCK
jgi:hypothetical protein